MNNFLKNELSRRILLCLLLDVVIAGMIGPSLINDYFLNVLNFSMYGVLANAILLWLVILALILRNKFKSLSIGKYSRSALLYIFAAFLMIPVFFKLEKSLLQSTEFDQIIVPALLAHALVFVIPILILLGTLGFPFIKLFAKHFYKQMLLSGIVSISAVFILLKLSSLWLQLSQVILQLVRFFLIATSISTTIIPPTSLQFDGLTIDIGQTCSGIESLFMFTIFYVLIAAFEWDGFNKMKLGLLYIPAVFGLFLFNSVRIYLIILSILFISSDFGMQIVHPYLGLLFFVIYFSVFWKFGYARMKK
jgi:exosortase/archaeosortase family protein